MRDIDTSDLSKLSKDDLIYLSQRNRLTQEEEAEYLPDGYAGNDFNSEGERLADVENTGDVGTHIPDGGSPPPDPNSSEEDDTPYEEWTVDELKEEIDARNEQRDGESHISKTGNKAELIEALEQDDEDD
jgi:hypothetical protein